MSGCFGLRVRALVDAEAVIRRTWIEAPREWGHHWPSSRRRMRVDERPLYLESRRRCRAGSTGHNGPRAPGAGAETRHPRLPVGERPTYKRRKGATVLKTQEAAAKLDRPLSAAFTSSA